VADKAGLAWIYSARRLTHVYGPRPRGVWAFADVAPYRDPPSHVRAGEFQAVDDAATSDPTSRPAPTREAALADCESDPQRGRGSTLNSAKSIMSMLAQVEANPSRRWLQSAGVDATTVTVGQPRRPLCARPAWGPKECYVSVMSARQTLDRWNPSSPMPSDWTLPCRLHLSPSSTRECDRATSGSNFRSSRAATSDAAWWFQVDDNGRADTVV